MTRIAAVLTNPETVAACLEAAVVAASLVPDEQVEAFHPRLRPESFILPSEEVMTEKRRASLTAMLDQKSDAIRGQVNAWASRNSNGFPTWVETEGQSIGAIVAERARDADLIVMVRPSDRDGNEALHAAIFDTGRLFLLVPPWRDAGLVRFGRDVVIAWTASDQARAAVLASIPWLRRAATITVVEITQAEKPTDDSDEVLSLLHPYGLSAEFVAHPKGDFSVAERLLHEAHARRADCLVMGAYRHNRIVEMILGGVTRHMVQHADLPIFMLH
jgi:nucleotide-binding universal stress UspA family protein